MVNINLIAPEIKEDEQLRPLFQEEVHERFKDRWNPYITIENIRFVHKHHFFDRVFSVRAAADWRHNAFWFYIAMLFFLSQLAWLGIGVGFKLFYPYIPYLPNAL